MGSNGPPRHSLSAALITGGLGLAIAAAAPSAKAQVDVPTPPTLSRDAYQPVEIRPRALVVPMDRAVLAAGVSSRIEKMPYRPGQSFAKGDVLVSFDCSALRAAADAARAELAAADARLQSDEQRLSLNAIGKLDLDISQAEHQRAQAETRARDSAVRQCAIQAPYSGRVTAFHANPHETVQAGKEVIEIIGDETLEIEVIVPSVWLRWLDEGAPFAVRLDETNQAYIARVTRIAAEVDPASQSVKVIGSFEKRPADARAGMSGETAFQVSQ